MKINGIEGLSITDIQSEIGMGGKFVTFNYCISIVVLSFRKVSDTYFIRADESGFKKGLKYTLTSLALGWWGIPMGIFWTLEALFINISGGKNVTKETLDILNLSMNPSNISAPSLHQPPSEPIIQSPQKTCPKCAEKILLEASVCRYCGHQFNETEVAEAQKDFQARVERDKADADIREQQRMVLIRVRDLHNNVAKAKSKANAWILPLLFGGGIGAFACIIVATALVFIVPMVGGPSEPTAIPGCSGIVVLIIAWIATTFWFRRNAKEKSGIMVEDEEDTLKEAVDEIEKIHSDWVNEIGGTKALLDYQKLKSLLATYTSNSQSVFK